MNPVLLLRLLLSVYSCCFIAWLQRSAAWLLLLPGNCPLSLIFLNCTTIFLPGYVFLKHIIWHFISPCNLKSFLSFLETWRFTSIIFLYFLFCLFFLSLWDSSSIKCCHFSVSLQVILLHIFHLCIPNWRFLGLLPCLLGHWFVLY